MSAPDGIDLDRQIARMKEEFESCKILHGEGSEWAIEAGSILASLIELQDARITAALEGGKDGVSSDAVIDNLAMMLRRMIWQANKMDGDVGIKVVAGKAKELLALYGLQGSPLRDEKPKGADHE